MRRQDREWGEGSYELGGRGEEGKEMGYREGKNHGRGCIERRDKRKTTFAYSISSCSHVVWRLAIKTGAKYSFVGIIG